MDVLTVQNPHHKCDQETRMTTEKKIIADYNNDYYMYMYAEIAIPCIILVCTYTMYVCVRV